MAKKLTYKSSGVNIKKADDFVKAIKSSVPKRGGSGVSAFGSLFDLGVFRKSFKNPVLVSSTDGVGTKLLLAQKFNIHHTVGIDLVAMNVNDLLCLGARPLFFLDYIACGKINPILLLSVVKGIEDGLTQSGCTLLGGETAEMPGMYKPNEYDLAGFCVGIVDKNKIINGKNIKKGDVIIGLESSGIHSNGYSLVRKALTARDLKTRIKEILTPTRIYVKPALEAIAKNPKAIKGIAHITGGAFYNKATKVLPKGLSMLINKKSWNIPSIFKLIQKRGRISEKEMFTVFNMGIGMMMVVDKKKVNSVLRSLSKHVKAHVIGVVIKDKRRMILQ